MSFRVFPFLPAIAGLLIAIFLLDPRFAMAQDAAPQSVSETSQAAATSADDQHEIDMIRVGFDSLRLMNYIAFGVGLAGALVVYVFVRKHLYKRSALWGGVVAVVLPLLVFGILVPVVSTTETVRCSSAVLREGDDATEYDEICRESREKASDAFGTATAFRHTFVRKASSYVVPIGAGALKFVTWFTLPLVTLLAYLLLFRVARRLFVKV